MIPTTSLILIVLIFCTSFYFFNSIRFDVHREINSENKKGDVHLSFSKFQEDFEQYKNLLFASKRYKNSLFSKFPEQYNPETEKLENWMERFSLYSRGKFYIHASYIIINGNQYIAKNNREYKKAMWMISEHYKTQVQKNLFDS